jgi:23S rRNA pseudouridine2457 synthase
MENAKKHQHFIICKPYGYLSQFISNQTKRTNKKMLGELHSFPENTMAIGRLDEDSEGLLLLTTDGKMSEFIRSKKVEKEYYAQVDGIITYDAIEKLQKGVEIGFDGGKYLTKPSKASKLIKEPHLIERKKKIRDERHGPTSWISITLTEGKFRQIRKMTSAVGFPTLRLIRNRIGNIHLNSMSAGEVIEVETFLRDV